MNPKGVFKRIDYTVLLWALLGVLLCLIFFNSLNREFDHDEFEAIHSAWKVLQGYAASHHPKARSVMLPGRANDAAVCVASQGH